MASPAQKFVLRPEENVHMIPSSRTRHRVTLAWQPYRRFTMANVHCFVPVKAGVYKLAVHLKTGKKRVFYVGQASDLFARLKDHFSGSEPNDCLRFQVEQYLCSFTVAVVTLAQDRNAAERALYLHFRPSCNDHEPSSPDFIVTPLTTG
jgi:excinuclease UvrABC nuclease subunit